MLLDDITIDVEFTPNIAYAEISSDFGVIEANIIEPDPIVVNQEELTELSLDVTFIRDFFSVDVSSPEEVIELGLVSLKGEKGESGDIENLPDGDITGDLLRWNETEGAWEVKSEPFEFKGIKLTPQEESLLEEEGVIYYSSLYKSVLVCVDE